MGCACGKSTAVTEIVPTHGTRAPKKSRTNNLEFLEQPLDEDSPTSKRFHREAPEIISRKVAQSVSTCVLVLRECGLETLPDGCMSDEHENMRTVDLSDNVLVKLPERVDAWHSLQNLLCGNNALEGLPASLGQLGSLQKFVLTSNRLRVIPVEVVNLGKLKILALDNNRLGPTMIDIFAGAMASSLEELDLAENMLSEIPVSVCNLTALIRLNLARNNLQALPENMGNLSCLQNMDASINQLTSVPASLFQCTSLSGLWLKGNPLDRLKLQEIPGFDQFLERRKQRLDSKIDSNVVGAIDLTVCGLD